MMPRWMKKVPDTFAHKPLVVLQHTKLPKDVNIKRTYFDLIIFASLRNILSHQYMGTQKRQRTHHQPQNPFLVNQDPLVMDA